MFSLTAVQKGRVRIWSVEQDDLVRSQQNLNEPYYGAIGGELTYSFTPTSIGVIVKVAHAVTKSKLDVSDYERF